MLDQLVGDGAGSSAPAPELVGEVTVLCRGTRSQHEPT